MTHCPEILTDVSNGVMSLTLNRPAKKNAINKAMYDAMRAALTEADQRDDVHVVLLQGSAESFTVGNDLGDFNERAPGELSPGGKFLLAIHQLKKPVIAAVSGFAVGIGVTVLLHCDVVYAAEDTRFRLPFVNLGIVPEAGSTLLLPSRCGHIAASELLLFGDFFDPATALKHGLVNKVLPSGELEDFARERAAELAQKPLQALIETKRLLKAANHQVVHDRIIEELDLFGLMLLSEESIQARQQALKK